MVLPWHKPRPPGRLAAGNDAGRGDMSPSHHCPVTLEPTADVQTGKGSHANPPGCQKHFWSKTCCLPPGSELCRASASHPTACDTQGCFAGCSCFRPAFSCPSRLRDPGLVPQPMLGTEKPVCDGDAVQRTRENLPIAAHTLPSTPQRGRSGASPGITNNPLFFFKPENLPVRAPGSALGSELWKM